MATTVLASIGDHGVLNAELAPALPEVWIDRDLSWLDFNERVLAEALDERTPLLERAKFLAIFTSNLDEFFMKRRSRPLPGARATNSGTVSKIREKLMPMLRRRRTAIARPSFPALRPRHVLRRWDELTAAQQARSRRYFDSSLSPALTPLVIDPAHPFPFLSNLSTSLVFRCTTLSTAKPCIARVKVPGVLKQWISLTAGLEPGEKLFVPLHEVIRGNATSSTAAWRSAAITMVRLTRDAEVETR